MLGRGAKMPISFGHSVMIIVVVSICTYFTRAAAFLLLGGKREVPSSVKYLGKVLPPAIIAILVVYCLKGINPVSFPFGLPEIIAVLCVGLLHIWQRNNLLSIGLGTIIYMVLIQLVF